MSNFSICIHLQTIFAPYALSQQKKKEKKKKENKTLK
jgi:hypothetical protein